jgi:hypothetical protein
MIDGLVWRKSTYSGGDTGACVEVADVLCVCDASWQKSSHSSGNGGNCVEVGTDWHKSSYSNASGGECVEVAEGRRSVLVRDMQNRDLGHLGFPATEWASFLREVKSGVL